MWFQLFLVQMYPVGGVMAISPDPEKVTDIFLAGLKRRLMKCEMFSIKTFTRKARGNGPKQRPERLTIKIDLWKDPND